MALHKQVKKGGTYFKGYQLSIDQTGGDYTLDVDRSDAFYVSAVEYIADASDAGDYITIARYSTTGGGAVLKYKYADTIHNPGPFRPHKLEFPALQAFDPGESLRVTYTHGTTGSAINLQVYVEFIGPTITS